MTKAERCEMLRYRKPALESMSFFQDKNHSLLDTIRSIEKAYEEWDRNQGAVRRSEAEKRFDNLIETLPEECFVV